MTVDSPDSSGRKASPSVAARCLRLLAGALLLLLVSEAIWLWQTWPVRQLLQTAATAP